MLATSPLDLAHRIHLLLLLHEATVRLSFTERDVIYAGRLVRSSDDAVAGIQSARRRALTLAKLDWMRWEISHRTKLG